MKRMFETITGNYSSSASVVDGTLILSLPDAVSPVVWRLDLVQTKASALEVRDDGIDLCTLVLKTPRGDINEIARFESRGRAVNALMAVTRAMEQAQSHIHTAANDRPDYNPTLLPVPSPRKRANKVSANGKSWIGAGVAVLLVVLLGVALVNMVPRPASGPAQNLASQARTQTAAPPVASGVAVSADDFLKSR